QLVNVILAENVPASRLMAAAVKLTVTFVVPPGGKTPWVGEPISQDAVFSSDQIKTDAPELVSSTLPELGLKGPPAGPNAVKPVAGVMPNGSGGAARALM